MDGQRIGAAEFANCQFRGAYLKLVPGAGTTPVPVTFWNNVWAQCSVTCHRYCDADLRVDLRHNLFSQGGLYLYRTTFASNPTWTATDNLFDAVTLSLAGLYITGDYNGYTSASAAFGGTHNQPNLVPVWATGGTLGPWYYPTTGGPTTLYTLVNAGSQSATNAGLYHYTTRVDQSVAGSLAAELNTFTNDLIGDGWTLSQHHVARQDNLAWATTAINGTYIANLQATRSIISNAWKLNPTGTNVVILLGHVTIPYSGAGAEDGHGDHHGAWPADAWYGDVDGEWGDSQNYATNNRVLQNLANDGKWDRLNNSAPTNLSFEVSVGRIDFDGLPAFAPYVSPVATNAYDLEIKLLKRYLSKVHAYRTGNLTFDPSLRLFMQGGASGPFSQLGTVAQSLATKNFGQALME